MIKPNGTVMLIVGLVLELDRCKKALKKEKAKSAMLGEMLQQKLQFEVRA